ncbi:MAG TPA: hypothetical protein VMZ25_01170, partial [Terriglobales bacterium]|nr:hypothetical protein [Terriglobales bacterium]
KFAHTRFEPSGWTQNPELGFAKSIMDYIFRWLQLRFIDGQQQTLFEGLLTRSNLYQGAEESDPNRALPAVASDFETRNPKLETRPPQGGLATEPGSPGTSDQPLATPTDRGLSPHVHASNALKGLVDLGDAPSCHVCGAIMTRNGSCYRCGECGSTSGCS